MGKKIRKPKPIILWDAEAECLTEVPEWEEAFCVKVDGYLYDSKQVEKLIKFLRRSLVWIKHKERKRGR